MSPTRSTIVRRGHAGSLLALTLAAAATPANADLFSLYIDDEAHLYTTTGMPDFDQWRLGLPDDGECHCGPTSATNLLAFIAMHDAPHVLPFLPETSWNDPGTYLYLTGHIFNFGVEAGTTHCSTDHSEMVRGIEAAGDGWVGRNFDVSRRAWDRKTPSSVPPRVREFTGRLAAERAVGIAFRSTWTGMSPSSDLWITSGEDDRRGGHYMTAHSALRAGDIDRLLLRHSSDETSQLETQSRFAVEDYDVNGTAFFYGSDVDILDRLGDPFIGARSGDLLQHFFYGYLIVSPKCWFEWGEGDHILERIPRGPSLGGTSPGPSAADFGSPITCAAFDSSGGSVAVVSGGRLHRVKPNEVNDLVIEPIDLDLPEVRTIDFDRNFGLHAIAGASALLVDWHTGTVRSAAPLPAPGTDVVVIDERPHVLMPGIQAIAAVTHGDVGGNPQTTLLPLPPGVMADQESTLAMLPGGRLFLLTDGVLQPMRITPNGLEAIDVPVPRNGQWKRVARVGRDQICLADAGGRVEVHELTPQGFRRLADHAFDGIQSAANFLPSRSRLTQGSDQPDPAYQGDADDAGVTVVDCPADLNLDGRVDSADMGLMLGDWGSNHSRADLNHDGRVDAADLGLLLGLFGACP